MSRNRDLSNMARSAGLEPLAITERRQRLYVEARAPNGATESFSILAKKSDGRDDMGCHTHMKRFARANRAPDAKPEAEPEQTHEAPAAPAATISTQPRKRITLKTAAPKTAPTTTTAAPAPSSQATQELTTAELYRLCEWTKTAVGPNVPSLEALALAASRYIGQPVSELTMREAMQATGTPEPDHWHPLPDTNVVLARELSAVLTELGLKPSAHFSRLVEALA